jgi:hypothetical protein
MKHHTEVELLVSKAKMNINGFMHAKQYKMAFETFIEAASKLDGRMLRDFVQFFKDKTCS